MANRKRRSGRVRRLVQIGYGGVAWDGLEGEEMWDWRPWAAVGRYEAVTVFGFQGRWTVHFQGIRCPTVASSREAGFDVALLLVQRTILAALVVARLRQRVREAIAGVDELRGLEQLVDIRRSAPV